MNVRSLCLAVLMCLLGATSQAQSAAQPLLTPEQIRVQSTEHYTRALQRRTHLEEAEYQAKLLETQERAAAALRRCAEHGVRCGLDLSLEDLSAEDLTAPAVQESISSEPPPSAPKPGPTSPDELFAHLQSAPLAVPILEGFIGHQALFLVKGQTLKAGRDDALPGGWRVTALSRSGATLTHQGGEVRHLLLRWKTGSSADQPAQQSSSSTAPAYPLNLPAPEWMQ